MLDESETLESVSDHRRVRVIGHQAQAMGLGKLGDDLGRVSQQLRLTADRDAQRIGQGLRACGRWG